MQAPPLPPPEPIVHEAIIEAINEMNIGKCIDYEKAKPGLRIGGPEYEDKIGWKIMGINNEHIIHLGEREIQVRTYKVKSDYGNGNEEDKVYGFMIKDIYDCPVGAQGMQINGANDMIEQLPGVEGVNHNNNENMEGGKRKYKKSRKVRTSKKTRKGRKSRGKSRKH